VSDKIDIILRGLDSNDHFRGCRAAARYLADYPERRGIRQFAVYGGPGETVLAVYRTKAAVIVRRGDEADAPS
jgi:hypothetical protein